MSRFLSYDQDQLDLQYDNQRRVDPDYLSRTRALWTAQNAEARASLPCTLDIAYGTGERARLDVFRTAASAPAPVQVYIHGGYWHYGGRSDASYVAAGLTAAGYTTVVVGYDLMPDQRIGGQVEQLRNALAWVYGNIARHGGDPERIFLTGHSAGGHLAAMLLASDFMQVGAGLPGGLIKGVTCLSGIYDLEPIRLSFLQEKLSLSETEVKALSPALSPPRDPDARLTLAVGSLEGQEFFRQACTLAGAWRGSLADIRIVNLPGRDHFSIRGALSDGDSDVTRLVLATGG